jgi:secreted PhoX family phosphatase
MVYVAVQHPGEEGSWAVPRSFFPDYLPQGTLQDGGWGGPRPSVIQVFRAGR